MTTVAAPAPVIASTVEDALLRSIRIPPRPSLLVDLQRELAETDPSPRRIARIIGNDVGMSGALLKLANSPYFGAARKAKSVEQAINFLGINQCAALLTGLLARNWGLSPDVSWAILHHHDYAVMNDDATDDAVRSLLSLIHI